MHVSPSGMTYKPPQQQRSQESLERILDAAETLIRERGFESMTIAEVVQRSGSSVGSLYGRFRNKLALLQAVQVRYHARVENAIAAEFQGDRPPGESLERILDAAETLIRERGFESMTIAEVVQRSGSSVGSLYGRFRNKLALLQAVQVRYHARVENAIAAEFQGDRPPGESLEQAARRIVRVLCDYLLSEPELFRAFVLQAVFDPRVRAQGEAANAKRRERVANVLMVHRGEIVHPDPDVAVRWFYSVCMAILRERITLGQAAELSGGFGDEEMRRELARTVVRFLTCVEPPEHRTGDS
jgi:AcrR family transcriptional regulator